MRNFYGYFKPLFEFLSQHLSSISIEQIFLNIFLGIGSGISYFYRRQLILKVSENIGFMVFVIPLTFICAETLNFIITGSPIITDVINYSDLEIPIPKERSIAEFSFDNETCQKDTPVGDKEKQKDKFIFHFFMSFFVYTVLCTYYDYFN